MVVHPQLLQSDRQWHQSVATMALLAAVLWIGSLDRRDSSAMAGPVSTQEVTPAVKIFNTHLHPMQPKIAIIKDRALLMRLYAGVDKK